MSPQLSVSDKKYRAAGGMMRLSLIPLRDQADLPGPALLGWLLLTVIYRDRVKWVCLAVGLFTGSVSFEFLLEKVREMCGFILTAL